MAWEKHWDGRRQPPLASEQATGIRHCWGQVWSLGWSVWQHTIDLICWRSCMLPFDYHNMKIDISSSCLHEGRVEKKYFLKDWNVNQIVLPSVEHPQTESAWFSYWKFHECLHHGPRLHIYMIMLYLPSSVTMIDLSWQNPFTCVVTSSPTVAVKSDNMWGSIFDECKWGHNITVSSNGDEKTICKGHCIGWSACDNGYCPFFRKYVRDALICWVWHMENKIS